jgi:hypothetical protein
MRVRPATRLLTSPLLLLVLRLSPAHADVLTQDSEERKHLARELPAASEALILAEASLATRHLEEATAHFARARTLAPRSPLAARRHCEVLAARGFKAEALAACDRAKALGAGPLEMRATVSAYLAGDAPPTADDLAHAWFYASQVQRQVPTLAYAYAARCEIALRIGDGRLLRTCLDDLARIAPQDAETQRFAAAADSLAPLVMWLGLGTFALLGLGTLVHALSRASRSRLKASLPLISGVTVLLALGAAAAPARAALDPAVTEAHLKAATAAQNSAAAAKAPAASGDLSPGAIDEANPEASVPAPGSVNPLQYGYVLQDLLARADAATTRSDWPAVVRYYRAVVKMVPDRSAGFSKLCQAYEKVGQLDLARKSCALALSADGVLVDDHARFVRLVLGKPGPLDEADRAQIHQVVTHLRKEERTVLPAFHLQCELAIRDGDQALLEACSRELAARAPADPKTVGFQWALAMQKRRFDEARALIDRAKRAGVQPDGIASMEALTDTSLSGQRKKQISLVVALVALLGFGGLAVVAARGRGQRRASPA